MRTAILALCAGAAVALSVGAARADCICVANGIRFTEGETACLSLPAGPRLARCEKVLNNSSWTILETACQQTTALDARTSAPAIAYSAAVAPEAE